MVRGDELIGVISWSDILRLSSADALGSDDRAVDATLDHSFTLEQVMSADPIYPTGLTLNSRRACKLPAASSRILRAPSLRFAPK